MKKIFSTVFLLFFIFTICQGQTKLGVSFGFTDTKIAVSDYQNIPDTTQAKFNGSQSFRFAISSFFRLNDYFTLRPELALLNSPFNEQLDSFNIQTLAPPGWLDVYRTSSDYNFMHLRLPVLLNFSFHLLNISKPKSEGKKASTLSMDVFGGPYISFAINHKRKSLITHTRSASQDTSKRYNFTQTRAEETSLNSSQINQWDYGAIMGLGLKAGITGGIQLFIEARSNISSYDLNNGLWDRIAQKPNNPFETHIVKPKIRLKNSIFLSAGVLFSIDFSKINVSSER